MLFNSWTFLLFLLITFAIYHGAPWPRAQRGLWQIAALTVASYVFYAWHTPWLAIVLAVSTGINCLVTLRLLDPSVSPPGRKSLVGIAVFANLAVLAFFKYASLLVATFLPQTWWSHWGFDLSQIPLPIGISFFTFQGISLVIDTYRAGSRGIEGLRPPSGPRETAGLALRMAFFKGFFPQLVAGPIVKAHEFMYQIGAKTLRDIDWDDAARKLILGYFLKMVVADNLKEVTAGLAYPAFVGRPGINLLFLLYGFSFQIFADFAGYSLIAMGLARLFGYRLPINFNFPYLAQSITEFWRRWHISLSTWLREYLYYPLGGNRKGPVRTYLNLIVVMLLGGLWHGAAWSYMVWGGAHGVLLAVERFFGVRRRQDDVRTRRKNPLGVALRILVTFHIVSLLWLLFQLPRFDQALLFLRELMAFRSGFAPQPIFAVIFFGMPVVLYHLWAAARPGTWTPWQRRHPAPAGLTRNFIYAVLLVLILINSGSPGAFIYFQF